MKYFLIAVLIAVSQVPDEVFLTAMRQKMAEIEQTTLSMSDQANDLVVKLDLLVEHRQLARALRDSFESRLEIIKRDSLRISGAFERVNSKTLIYDEMLAQKIRELYKRGDPSALEVFLSEESFSDFVGRMEYLTRTAEEMARIVKSMRLSKMSLQQKVDSMNAMIERMSFFQQQIEIINGQIEIDSLDMTALAVRLDSSIEAQQLLKEELTQAASEIDRQVRAQERSRSLTASIGGASFNPQTNSNSGSVDFTTVRLPQNSEIEINPDNFFEKSKGSIIWPVEGGGSLTHSVGESGTLEIFAPVGTEIKCVANGTVYLSERFGLKNNVVIIHHGDGYSTYYDNLSSPLNVVTGQVVRAGQVIGSVAENVQGESRTQFQIRIGGALVNPLDYLSGGK
ncbi:peptidoglycan DD-metalloendopeptidase family protein [candidate division WOR-3 bacterium]|nr:peptidoglycan DD-metalloendopeptidase family protein [candidate division WOR-3 bacterium]